MYSINVINVIMPSEDTKTDGCKSNPEKSYTTKANEHIPTGFIMSAILSFNPLTYFISSYLKLGKFNMVTIYCLRLCRSFCLKFYVELGFLSGSTFVDIGIKRFSFSEN